MKRKYQIPRINVISMKVEDQLLGVSNVSTKDPTEDGDPTGGNGGTPNPFDNLGNGAKANPYDFEEDL